LTLSGSTVTQWNDKSGQGRNAIRVGTGITYASSGVLFTGTGNFTTTFPASYSNETTYIVYNATNITGFQQFLGSQAGGRQFFFGTSPNGSLYVKNTFGSGVIGPPSFVITAAVTTILSYNNNGTKTTLSINGRSVASGNTVSYTSGTTSILGAYATGASSYSDYFNGNMYEIIGYPTSLSLSQQQQVEGYLAWKWGLVASLPNGHPFKQPPIAPFPYAVRRAVPGPSLSSFSLRSISGITLWMDAADASTLTLSGTSVTQWRDKSLSGYVFTSPSPPVSGVNTMNGLNVVTNQGSQYLQITNYSQTFTTCSFFVVMKPTGSFGSWDFLGIFMSQTTGAPYFYIELSATMVPNRYSFATTVNGRDAFAGNLGSSSVSGITYLLSGFVTGNTSTNFQNLNGTPFESYNYNLTTGGLASNLSNVTIRLAGWPSNSKSGQYAEILMFDRILPQRDYQQVEGYLAWKWGLQTSLPANHPYRANSPK
jgi:hypothetical protein